MRSHTHSGGENAAMISHVCYGHRKEAVFHCTTCHSRYYRQGHDNSCPRVRPVWSDLNLDLSMGVIVPCALDSPGYFNFLHIADFDVSFHFIFKCLSGKKKKKTSLKCTVYVRISQSLFLYMKEMPLPVWRKSEFHPSSSIKIYPFFPGFPLTAFIPEEIIMYFQWASVANWHAVKWIWPSDVVLKLNSSST